MPGTFGPALAVESAAAVAAEVGSEFRVVVGGFRKSFWVAADGEVGGGDHEDAAAGGGAGHFAAVEAVADALRRWGFSVGVCSRQDSPASGLRRGAKI